MTRRAQSMLLTDFSEIVAKEIRQSAESNGASVVQETRLVIPPTSCLRLLSEGTGLPDGYTRYRGPRKRESGRYHDKNRKKTSCSRVLCLTDPGFPKTSASPSLSFMSVASLTYSFWSAWLPRNALLCPNSSRSHPSDILV